MEHTANVKPPQQARSRRTLDRIVRAGLDLAAEEGVAGVTVAKVVARARSSVGSFYARFSGKDDLIRYLEQQVWEEAGERWQQAVASQSWDDRSLKGVVEGLVGLLVRSYQEDFGRRRALGGRGEAPGGSRGLEDAFHEAVLRDLRRFILTRSDEITHPDPGLAVQVGYRILIGGIKELVAVTDQLALGAVSASPDLVRQELSRSFLGYLGGTGLPERDEHEEEMDFGDPFDIWG